MQLRNVFTLLALLCLTACSNWQAKAPLPDYPANAPAAEWTLRGKLGVRQGDERHSMHLFWQTREDDFTLRLSAPLGGQQAVILRANGLVTAALPDGEVYHANTAEALFERLYGWHAPVNSLRWWVRGLPDPALPGRTLAQDDPLERHYQQGPWQLRWRQYRHFGETPMPGRIDISGPDALTITIIVQDWEWPARQEPAS